MCFRSIILLLSLLLCSQLASGAVGPITNHFQNWLKLNNYESYDFARSDYGNQGSYGGFVNSAQRIKRDPVVFIHGNSDSALKTTRFATGWDNSIDYFLSKGYTSGELYATSWQDNQPNRAGSRTHDCKDLIRLRKFLEAIYKYTGARSISVIGHSMGVTLGRKIIQGGIANGTDGYCDLGSSLGSQVEVFIGISGANYGLCSCTGPLSSFAATCNKINGFWPGDSCNGYTSNFCGFSTISCSGSGTYSSYLMDLNRFTGKQAVHLFSLWSKADDLINNADIVWGQPTSLIPKSDGKIIYNTLTHEQSKDNTAEDQYNLVTRKTV